MNNEMKKDNSAAKKSFAFALKVVKHFQHLSKKKKEFVLNKQVLRSGTGIGVNLEESPGARSLTDFQAKNSVVYKGALETSYRVGTLQASKYITGKQFQGIHSDCQELIKVLGATQLTMRNKLQKGYKS